MTTYRRNYTTRTTPQGEAIPGENQVRNSAGGFVYELDKWAYLRRFLILGVEGATYYSSQKKLVRENALNLLACIAEDGVRVVREVVDISHSGRAPKNDPCIFALALCCTNGNETTRNAAYNSLSSVCRIGTHLFQWFSDYAELGTPALDKNGNLVKGKEGTGRHKAGSSGAKRAVQNWYSRSDLALQLIKYRERNGVSHSDLIYLMRPKLNEENSLLIRWLLERRQHGNKQSKYVNYSEIPHPLIEGFERIQSLHELNTENEKLAAKWIREYELPREAVPTELLNSKEVWAALLEKMPMTAMIRNLATMTRVGLLVPFSESVKKVEEQLGNESILHKARIHPLQILLALKTYAAGRGFRSSHTWTPVTQVIDALNESFYLAFHNVEPTGKNWYLGVDVSGSMSMGEVAGTNLTPREAAAALSLVTARTEQNYVIKGFQGGNYYGSRDQDISGMVPLNITPSMRLDDVVRNTSGLPYGTTDCALPMLDALHHKYPIDVFVVITDNETWVGNIHPIQALDQYQQKMGRAAKLIVVGMTATKFTIAKPERMDNLDVVGFDAAIPELMRNFVIE